MKQTPAPIYDPAYKQHRCRHCKHLIFFERAGKTWIAGRCWCGTWYFDFWDLKRGRWFYEAA